MFKRISIFLGLNILIVLTVSFLLNIFHVAPYLRAYGLDYQSLAIFCLIWGMAGALISLCLSRSLAKWMLGVRLIDARSGDHESQMLISMVTRLAQRAGLPDVPQIGIFESAEPNAFATGPTKRRSLVAVSRGLLRNLSKEEIEAVLGHEISHIANGDMVTMTLIQGVINAFVMFLARVLAFALSTIGRSRDDRRGFSYGSYILFTYLFEIVFMILGSLLVAFVSRKREFRADKGSSDLLGKAPMISALRKLESIHTKESVAEEHQGIAALMINRPRKRSGLLALFASHPPIEERISRLERGY